MTHNMSRMDGVSCDHCANGLNDGRDGRDDIRYCYLIGESGYKRLPEGFVGDSYVNGVVSKVAYCLEGVQKGDGHNGVYFPIHAFRDMLRKISK